ncbi:TRI25 ligase, partial [Polypterus senegalus]
MAEAQLFVSQDEFNCSVCQDILNDPVSLHCGHSFCLNCLKDYWDQSQECRCPQCRHIFMLRPELHINTLLNEVIKKLKKTALSSSHPPPSQNYAGPGEVECDICAGKKFRAVKSCLTCMASYCQTHLQPHYEGDALKHHKLVDPDGNLKEKLCEKHQKSLELFCKTDEMCICLMCVVTGHKNHEMVELEIEKEEKEKLLGATLNDIKSRLEVREKTLKEMRRMMEEMKNFVERELEENEKSFVALIRCIEEAHRKLTERIKEEEKSEMEKAEGVMEQLEKEIEELQRIEAELKELSETKDHLHFLQVSLTLHRESDQTGVHFRSLTLDINTANRVLHLSEGNKKVTREWTKAEYPDHPDRFDYCVQVLCSEALIGTRCYWEVECSGKSLRIGVAYKGLSRKAWGRECSLGNNDKSWSLQWSHSQYSVHNNNNTTAISAPYSPRIGHEAPVFALQPPEPQSRDDFLKYFCPLILNINTAHRDLCLSEGNKMVTHEWTEAEYPYHPDRFDCWT